MFGSNCGNSETPTFSAEPARVWYPVEMKSFGRCLCVSSSVPLSQRSRSRPHEVLGGRVVAVLALLPRRPALPGVQLGGQLCPVAQDSEMAPGPGLSATARLQRS